MSTIHIANMSLGGQIIAAFTNVTTLSEGGMIDAVGNALLDHYSVNIPYDDRRVRLLEDFRVEHLRSFQRLAPYFTRTLGGIPSRRSAMANDLLYLPVKQMMASGLAVFPEQLQRILAQEETERPLDQGIFRDLLLELTYIEVHRRYPARYFYDGALDPMNSLPHTDPVFDALDKAFRELGGRKEWLPRVDREHTCITSADTNYEHYLSVNLDVQQAALALQRGEMREALLFLYQQEWGSERRAFLFDIFTGVLNGTLDMRAPLKTSCHSEPKAKNLDLKRDPSLTLRMTTEHANDDATQIVAALKNPPDPVAPSPPRRGLLGRLARFFRKPADPVRAWPSQDGDTLIIAALEEKPDQMTRGLIRRAFGMIGSAASIRNAADRAYVEYALAYIAEVSGDRDAAILKEWGGRSAALAIAEGTGLTNELAKARNNFEGWLTLERIPDPVRHGLRLVDDKRWNEAFDIINKINFASISHPELVMTLMHAYWVKMALKHGVIQRKGSGSDPDTEPTLRD